MSGQVSRRGALDEGKQREICAILSVGCTRATAASYVGCCVETIRNTARREPLFAQALAQAETGFEVKNAQHLQNAAKEGRYWRAAAWALERRYPDRWAQRRALSINFEQLQAVLSQFAELLLDAVADEELKQRVALRLSELTASLMVAAAKGATS